MRILFLSVAGAFVLGISAVAYAQTPPPGKPGSPPLPVVQPAQPAVSAPIPCPQVMVQGPGRPMKDGEQIGFAANVGGGDPTVQPMYNWSISSGTIISGQGTRNILIDSTGAGADRQVTADLLISGYSYECNNRATATVPIAAPPKKVDEFGDLPEKDEAGKLDSIVNYLNQQPDRIYLIAYAGRGNPRGYAADVLRRMRAYATKTISPDRILIIDGGFREQPAYEIWVVPVGAESPRPTPTVDRKDIVYPKPPPRTPVRKPKGS